MVYRGHASRGVFRGTFRNTLGVYTLEVLRGLRGSLVGSLKGPTSRIQRKLNIENLRSKYWSVSHRTVELHNFFNWLGALCLGQSAPPRDMVHTTVVFPFLRSTA